MIEELVYHFIGLIRSIWIREDKIYHILLGFILYNFFRFCKIGVKESIFLVFIIALMKETFDWISGAGRVEFLDIIFTVVPLLPFLYFQKK